jgi:branched-chain amino acid aminotransferase
MPIQERYVAADGLVLEGSSPVCLQNRAMRYGDGVFETILVRQGAAKSLDLHIGRMLDGAKILGFADQNGHLRSQILSLVEKLLIAQDVAGHGRMRITAHRADGGHYLPTDNSAVLLGEIGPLSDDPWTLRPPKRACIAHTYPLAYSILSAAKSLNALPQVLAAKHAQGQGCDDAVLCSTTGEVAEFTACNLFAVIDGSLCTPRRESGCLPGTMRARTLAAAHDLGIQAHEIPISIAQLATCSEIFATNAIQGLQPIASIAGTSYKAGDFPMMRRLRAQLAMGD